MTRTEYDEVDHRHRRPFFKGKRAELSERCRRRLRRGDPGSPTLHFGAWLFLRGGTIAEPELNAPTSIRRSSPLTGEAAIRGRRRLGAERTVFLARLEKRLYVVESRAVPNRKIRVFDVIDGRYLGASRVLIDAGAGTPDGFRCDMDGNIWAGWGMGTADLDGVMIFDPEGQLIGRIALPERCANLCFGGRQRNRLFMACGHGLYALYVNAQGAV